MILDLIALHPDSKVWVYQANQFIDDETAEAIKEDLFNFLESWTSHNQKLYTYGNVFHYRFLAIFVDERFAGASGCSIDKSMHFIEQLEQKYSIIWTERNDVAYLDKKEDEDGEDISIIHTVPLNELKTLYENNVLNDATFVFNNLVQTKKEFLTSWVTPLGDSWHKRFVR